MSEQDLSIPIANPFQEWTVQFSTTEPIARLWVEDGLMHFEGNMDQAAKMFFEHYLKPICDNYIKTQRQATIADDMAKNILERS